MPQSVSLLFYIYPLQVVTDWEAPILVQAKFKVYVGVRSGSKGSVIDSLNFGRPPQVVKGWGALIPVHLEAA